MSRLDLQMVSSTSSNEDCGNNSAFTGQTESLEFLSQKLEEMALNCQDETSSDGDKNNYVIN